MAAQGTTLQMSANKRWLAAQQIQQALWRSKRQQAEQHVQAALHTTGMTTGPIDARHMNAGATWV